MTTSALALPARKQELDEIMDAIAELKENNGERFSIKQMERAKKSAELRPEIPSS